MENKAHALATGLFVLILGAVLVLVVLWFRGDRGETEMFTVVTRSGVPGLNVKAPVKLRGVQVGNVNKIRFDPQSPRQILVEIEVDSDAPIAPGTIAKLGYQGITGLSFIDLYDGEEPKDPKKSVLETRRIALAPSILDQLSDAGPKLAASAMEVMDRIKLVLNDGNQAQLKRTLTEMGEASAGLNQLVQDMRPAVKALPQLIRDANGLVVSGKRTLGTVDTTAQKGGELFDAYKERAAAVDKLGEAAEQVQTTLRRLELSLVGPGGDRPRQRAVLEDLSQAAKALERAAQGISDQPQSLLLGPRPAVPGPGEEGFDARVKEKQ
ncbi:MAG: MlaD family protein [Burkholderiaceae bacterium]